VVLCHLARWQTGQNCSHLNNSFRVGGTTPPGDAVKNEGGLIVEDGIEEGTVRGKTLIATEQPSGPHAEEMNQLKNDVFRWAVNI
jgi:hypothetical protein